MYHIAFVPYLILDFDFTVFIYLVEIDPAHTTRKRFDIFRMNKYKELCIRAIFDYYISTLFKQKLVIRKYI